MKIRLALGLTATGVLALALALNGLLPGPLLPWEPVEEPLAVSFRPLPERVTPDDEAADTETGAGARRALAMRPEQATERASPEPVAPIPASATVTARLVDRAGSALAGAILRQATPAGPGVSTTTGSDGRARLAVQLAAGQRGATIEAGCRGFASRSEEVRLAPGESVDLGTLVLEPGGAASGHVLDPSGAPVAGALVTLDGSGASARDLEAWRSVRGTPARLERVELPLALSGADGSFVLAGLPTGMVRLWAQQHGRVPSYTPPLEVRAGQESVGVRIVLPVLDADRRIAGVVLEPGGAPVPHAVLEFEFHTDDLRMTYTSERRADGVGRFEFMLPPDALLAITARDPEDRFAPASADGVRTAGPELVLRLGLGRPVRLVARGAGGEPLGAFAFEVLLAGEPPDAPERVLQRGHARPDAEPAALRLPDSPYLLRVVAPLHRVATLGPLAPAATGEEIEVRLAAAPELAGTVLSDAGPVAGASVALHALVPDDERLEHNGFRCWVEPEPIEEVVSDGDGRFVLTVRERGGFVVRAEGVGHAPGEIGPLQLDPGRSPPPVELRLGPGGEIVGRLVPALGEEAAGRVVAIDRGDGRARRKRVGPDGAFRFEGLTPGAWRVEALPEELIRSITQRSPALRSFEREVQWSCTVAEGETTRFDLIEADADAYLLEGRVELEGVDPTALHAWLCPIDLPLVECFDNPDRWSSSSPDSRGRFELGVPEPGPWRLVVKHAGARTEWVLMDEVRLAASRTEWELALGTGSVVVEGLAPMEADQDVPPFVYWWEDDAERRYLRLVAPDEAGTCTLDHVPTGEGRLLRPSLDQMLEPERWPVALALEVVAGTTTRVSVP